MALKLQQEFCPDLVGGSKAEQKSFAPKPERQKGEPTKELPAVVNEPLDFELKELDAKHPYLLGRGFTKSRVAIPLHDQAGSLIGYAGRVVDDTFISEENPRYRFPGERKRDGKTFEFRKTMFVYNGFNIKPLADDLIVVEGFSGVWWLTQNGFENAVATMGADCSEKQAEIIVSLVKPGGVVWIMPDGNTAGERCALALLRQISPHRLVRWVKMTDNKQPTDLSREQLKKSFIA
jgi:DNA primase